MIFNFINASSLIFIAAAVLPILVYFFSKKRPKKVVFSSIKFIQLTQQKQKQKIKLQQLLLLLLRVLTIVFLILGIARPALNGKFFGGSSHPQTAVAVLLDNSYSMDYLVNTSSDLNVGIEKAKELNSVLSNDDIVFVATRDKLWNEQYMNNPTSGNINEDILNTIKITANALPWDTVLEETESILKAQDIPNCEIYIFTDNQFEKVTYETAFPTYIIPTSALDSKQNLICERSFFQRNLVENEVRHEVVFTIYNTGDATDDVRCTLILDGQTRGEKIIQIEAGNRKEERFILNNLSSGWHAGEIRIDNERLPFDDVSYFAFQFQQHPTIGIFSPNQNIPLHINAIANVFTTKKEHILTINNASQMPTSPVDAWLILGAESLDTAQHYVLQTILESDVPVIAFATEKMDEKSMTTYENAFRFQFKEFEVEMDSFDFKKALDYRVAEFKKMDEIKIKDFWKLDGGKVLLQNKNAPILLTNDKNQYFFPFDAFSSSNPFWVEPSYAILMYRLLHPNHKQSIEKNFVGNRYSIDGQKIKLPNEEELLLHSSYFIPNEPGIYSVYNEDNNIQKIAINMRTKEGRFQKFETIPANWKNTDETWTSSIFAIKFGKELWKWMFFLAFLCLVLEMLYVRYLEKKIA